jgi:hypothetical protein
LVSTPGVLGPRSNFGGIMNRTESNAAAKWKVALAAMFALLLLGGGSVLNGQDLGIPDTCKYVSATSYWNILGDSDSLFSVSLWGYTDAANIIGATIGFKMKTSTGQGHGHDDSLIVVDTFFFFSPDTDSILFKIYTRSLLDESYDPTAIDWGYNGYAIGLLGAGEPVIPPNTTIRIGDVRLKIRDMDQLPDSFDIEIDSSWFPPAGPFKFSPSGLAGFPPKFTKATIIVKKLICGDVTNDAFTDIDDIVFLITFIFAGGPGPSPYEVGDVNCSGFVDIDDVVYVIQYVFAAGPPPCDGC